MTNARKKGGRGREGNPGMHPRNGEGTSKTKGRFGREARGGPQLRTHEELKSNKWRLLAGNV